jgi:lysophospholipase L1-like esterase
MIPRRIVAIGTSAFFGYGDPHNGGYIGRLKVWQESLEFENNIYNLGISGASVGETTDSLLKRLIPEALVREPDLILLTSGINDIRRYQTKESPCTVSLQQFEKNIYEIIARARTVAKDVIFISVYPLLEKHDSNDNWFLPDDNKKYAEAVKNICEKEKIGYIDVYKEWEQIGYNDLLGSDGVHANEKGHEKIYEQVKKFLLKRYS